MQAANINEIDEDEQLEKKQTVLANIAQLDLAANTAYYALIGNAANAEASELGLSTGAIDNLQIALSSLEKANKFDDALQPISETLNNALSLLEEAQNELRHYKDSLDTDPETLQEIEARIAQLATIKRKYGPSLQEALDKQNTLQEELDKLQNIAGQTDKTENELKSINKELDKLATTANKTRLSLATKLAHQTKKELSDLGMENCQFEIAFENCLT